MCRTKEKGSLIVELAFILPLLVYLVMSLLFVGVAIRDATVATNIVRESGRYASVQLAADPKKEKDYLGDTIYVMVPADEEAVKAKIIAFTKQQCEDRLAIYQCTEEPIITITTGLDNIDNKQENKQVKIAFTVELDEAYNYLCFSVGPKTISRSVVFRIEDHTVQIKDNG